MEKGQERAVERDPVARASERVHRQAPAKGKAGGEADVAAVRGEVLKDSVAARVVAEVGRQQTRRKEAIMPAGDGSGPMGMGPMTGRGMGLCAGVAAPGPMDTVPGRGFGMGCGRGFRGRGAGGGGRGWRNMFHATGLPGWARGGVPGTPAPAQELAVLKQQAESLGSALENIRKRIQQVESRPADK